MSTTSMDCIPIPVPHLLSNGTNWPEFAARFQEAMRVAQQWGHFNGTSARPVPKIVDAPTKEEDEALKAWDHEDIVAGYLLSQRLPDLTLLRLSACPTARARWEHLSEKHSAKGSQPEQGKQKKKEQLTVEGRREEAKATKHESGRRRRRGKCHNCGEEGHRARACRAPEGSATAPAAEATSGATAQPEPSPLVTSLAESDVVLEGGEHLVGQGRGHSRARWRRRVGPTSRPHRTPKPLGSRAIRRRGTGPNPR